MLDTVKTLLLEDPLAVYIALAFAELIFLTLWARYRTRAWLRRALWPIGLAAAVGLTAALVETGRERLHRTLRELAAAVEQGRLDAAAELVAEDYFDGRYRKADLLSAARRATDRYPVREVRVRNVRIDLTPPTARTAFRVDVVLSRPVEWRDRQAMDWTLTWEQRQGRWRLVRSRLDRPAGLPGAPGQQDGGWSF